MKRENGKEEKNKKEKEQQEKEEMATATRQSPTVKQGELK